MIELLIERLQDTRFVTMVLAILDTNLHELSIINAGHLLPLLRRIDGSIVALEGTEGAEVIPELAPADDDLTVEKHVYSSFFETPLDSLLRSRKVDTVILTGLHTHLCVRHTAADAFFRGYKILVPEDGVDSFTAEDHESGLAYLKEYYGATITDAASILKGLKK